MRLFIKGIKGEGLLNNLNPYDLISLLEYAIVFFHKVAVLKGGK